MFMAPPRMQAAHPVAGAMNDADIITAYFAALGAPERVPNAARQDIPRQSSAGTPQRILCTVSRCYGSTSALWPNECAGPSSRIFDIHFGSYTHRKLSSDTDLELSPADGGPHDHDLRPERQLFPGIHFLALKLGNASSVVRTCILE